MNGAPQQESPPGAVPQPAQQHGGQQITGRTGPSAPVPTKADVQVVPEPGAEADVPTSPEVLEAERPVWLVEVGREPEAEEQGDTDGNVAVAAEVAVDLKGVAVDGQQRFQPRGSAGVGEDTVDQLGAQGVGQDDLLEKTPDDELPGPTGLEGRPIVSGQLGQEIPGPHDGPGHQLGEEADKQSEVKQARCRDHDPTVDVDGVRHRLERVEADAHREDDPQWPGRHVHPEAAQQVHELVDEEPGVLEDGKHPQVGTQAGHQPEPSPAGIVGGVDGPSRREVHDGREPDKGQEPPVPPPVEDGTGHHHGGLPGRRPLQQYGVDGEDQHHEHGEGDGREQHGPAESATRPPVRSVTHEPRATRVPRVARGRP